MCNKQEATMRETFLDEEEDEERIRTMMNPQLRPRDHQNLEGPRTNGLDRSAGSQASQTTTI